MPQTTVKIVKLVQLLNYNNFTDTILRHAQMLAPKKRLHNATEQKK